MKKVMNTITYPAFALFAFACFALSPTLRGVSPPPDGGYPGQNTAEGDFELFSLTTGGLNTASGFAALLSNTTGSENTRPRVFLRSLVTPPAATTRPLVVCTL